MNCEVFSALAETDGDSIVVHLTTSVGPLTLRLPLERVKRLIHVLENGLKAADEVTKDHDVVYLSLIETVKKAYATKVGAAEGERVFLFIETAETGAHNFVMGDDDAETLVSSIERAVGKGPSTH